MFYFMSIIFAIIFLMAIVQSVDDIHYQKSSLAFQYEHKHSANIPKYIGFFYQLILGENPSGMLLLEWMIYVLFTILVNIIAMNLLIAILSNTYDKVMSTLDAIHFKTKVDILNEVQDYMFWNRNKNSLNHLYFVYYVFEDLNPNQKQDEWEGRVRIMFNQLSQVKDACKDIHEENQFVLKKQAET